LIVTDSRSAIANYDSVSMETLIFGASVGVAFGAGAALERCACLWTGEGRSRSLRTLLIGCFFGLIWTQVLLSGSANSTPLTSLLLLAAVLLAAVVDLDVRRIPNLLTAVALPLILLVSFLVEPHLVTERLLCALLIPAALFLAALARPGSLGMGDVKLAAVIGAGLGIAALAAILAALVIATLAALVIAAGVGVRAALATSLPLAPFLAVGVAIVLTVGG